MKKELFLIVSFENPFSLQISSEAATAPFSYTPPGRNHLFVPGTSLGVFSFFFFFGGVGWVFPFVLVVCCFLSLSLSLSLFLLFLF